MTHPTPPPFHRHRRRRRRHPAVVAIAGLAVALAGCTAGTAGSSTGSASGSVAAAPTTVAGSGPAGSGPAGSGPAEPGSAEPGSAGSGTAEQFTPIVVDVMSTPRWFTGTDGKVHLTYELRLVNAFPVPVTVRRIVVRDGDGDGDGGTLQDLSGVGLDAAMSLLVPQTDRVTELAPSTVGVVWMDVELDDASAVPTRIEHELTVDVPPGLPVPGTITSVGADADVAVEPPTVLGPPLAGPGWIAVGSCCDGPHRRTVQPIDNGLWVAQRFAIDFNKVDAAGLLAAGDPARNENWYTYDQPVLAVVDAVVVTAVDGLADQAPDAPTPVGIAEADGNHVILRLTDGRYAFYAHLRPGTVAVRAGDTVTKGQEIGRTGNSGSSTGAHLHFQLMDRPSALMADGLPYVFDSFVVTGRGPALAELIALNPATDQVPIDAAGAGPRTDQLPLSSDVVQFPAG